MQRLRAALPLLAAVVATWWLTVASAQSSIPNGVFVQSSDEARWLVLDGQRINVPVWTASDDDIQAIPKSDRWAVMNDAGAIVAGEKPAWLTAQELAQTAPAPRETASTPVAADREIVANVSGQQATSTFAGSPIRATVNEMTVISALPAYADSYGKSRPALPASGKWVVVSVKLENVGREAVCCPPEYRLKDSRGRFFSGYVGWWADPVEQAKSTIYPMPRPTNRLQPNLPQAHVLVYDVPTDATGFTLTPDR